MEEENAKRRVAGKGRPKDGPTSRNGDPCLLTGRRDSERQGWGGGERERVVVSFKG